MEQIEKLVAAFLSLWFGVAAILAWRASWRDGTLAELVVSQSGLANQPAENEK